MEKIVESVWMAMIVAVILGFGLRKVNSWMFERKLGEKKYSLPPGDLGWPFVGNMWSFLRAFKSSDPDSFISTFFIRYGRTGIYKAFLFGKPSIIVTSPETCRRVLTDDENFQLGWPASTIELIGKKSFISISYEEHKRLRKLTSAPINGHEALSMYIPYIEDTVKSALQRWASMGELEFLTAVRRLTFRIIMHIFLSSESEQVMESLERDYSALNYGIRAMAINVPGFAYHKALKARKRLVAIFQSIVDARRRKKGGEGETKKDMMDALMEAEDEHGKKLSDEEIIDLLVMYLNAGHESSGHTIMWATVLLQQHPEFLKKAKAEQELIVKNRPSTQERLNLKEIRQMEYLSKVIDETLRWLTFSFVTFREAKADVNVNGYTIPKGWKVLTWFRSVHLDPAIYPEPMKFDPSRWDDYIPKAGTFIPFGAGSRLCPGNDLAKLEISIFLHYFLLDYRIQCRHNIKSTICKNHAVDCRIGTHNRELLRVLLYVQRLEFHPINLTDYIYKICQIDCSKGQTLIVGRDTYHTEDQWIIVWQESGELHLMGKNADTMRLPIIEQESIEQESIEHPCC